MPPCKISLKVGIIRWKTGPKIGWKISFCHMTRPSRWQNTWGLICLWDMPTTAGVLFTEPPLSEIDTPEDEGLSNIGAMPLTEMPEWGTAAHFMVETRDRSVLVAYAPDHTDGYDLFQFTHPDLPDDQAYDWLLIADRAQTHDPYGHAFNLIDQRLAPGTAHGGIGGSVCPGHCSSGSDPTAGGSLACPGACGWIGLDHVGGLHDLGTG